MTFRETQLAGVFELSLELREDNRGFFARTFCEREFKEHGLADRFVECSVAWNRARGTLRGMHYQIEPFAEVKLVRCTRGAIYDVVLDLRPNSDTWGRWLATELTPGGDKLLYVPKGLAHGYQTLKPDTEVSYWMSSHYEPSAQRGVRWDDPLFEIEWPIADPILSERDRKHPNYTRRH